LPFERVLILLTGIETLCAEVIRRVERGHADWLDALPTEVQDLSAYRALSAWDIGALLDLWPLATERIDGLDLLASSLKPDGVLAIAGVSAAGIERTPVGFQRHAANTIDAHGFDSTEGFRPGESQPFEGPVPVGIWQSLLFMTTGRVAAPLITIDHGQRSEQARWCRLNDQEGL
jgi:hypothetical protein